jgi:hypothetical protein
MNQFVFVMDMERFYDKNQASDYLCGVHVVS